MLGGPQHTLAIGVGECDYTLCGRRPILWSFLKEQLLKRERTETEERQPVGGGRIHIIPEGPSGLLAASAAVFPASTAAQILTLRVKGTTPMASLGHSQGISSNHFQFGLLKLDKETSCPGEASNLMSPI